MNPNHSYNTVFVDYSVLNSVKAGKFYTTVRLGDQLFLFDENGKRTLIAEPDVKWKSADEVVMIAKIKSSHLDSVTEGKIYRVFNDEANDERYILDVGKPVAQFLTRRQEGCATAPNSHPPV